MIAMSKRVDSTLIRHAWARGQETIDRHEGETIATFAGRTCATFGAGVVVRMANAKGGTVAWTDDAGTIRSASGLPRPR